MKVPKYIKDKLLRRARCASQFTDLDCDIADWLDKNNIEVEEYDICGGCEAYVNPYESIKRILQAIEDKEN